MAINLICVCFLPIRLRLLVASLCISSPQDTIKLSRESHDCQSLRSDVEAVKRCLFQTDGPIAATGLTGLESAARRRALFPAELRDNISNWVQNRGQQKHEILGISEKSWKRTFCYFSFFWKLSRMIGLPASRFLMVFGSLRPSSSLFCFAKVQQFNRFFNMML